MKCQKCGKEVPKSEIQTVRLDGEIPIDYCEECVNLIKEQMKNYPKKRK